MPRRVYPWLWLLLLIAAAGAGARYYLSVHEVIPGQVYRSGQPTERMLERAIRRQHIRSVLNLRGKSESRESYAEETELTRRLGLAQYDLRFHAFLPPALPETRALVHVLDRAPKPLLIHCQAGVDRTGWAVAVTRLLRGEPLRVIESSLSPLRGHLCDTVCMQHRFFESYTQWLESQRKSHSSAAFRYWVLNEYCPEPYDAALTILSGAPGAVGAGEPLRYSVRVTNGSNSTWQDPPAADRGIGLGVRWLGPFETLPADIVETFRQPYTQAKDAARVPLGAPLQPRSSRDFNVTLTAPAQPGVYALQFDMVDEMVHWFSDLGHPGVIVPVRVSGR